MPEATLQMIAKAAGTSRQTVQAAINRGELAGWKVAGGGRTGEVWRVDSMAGAAWANRFKSLKRAEAYLRSRGYVSPEDLANETNYTGAMWRRWVSRGLLPAISPCQAGTRPRWLKLMIHRETALAFAREHAEKCGWMGRAGVRQGPNRRTAHARGR